MTPKRLPARVLAVTLTGAAVLVLLGACAGAPGPNNVAEIGTGHISGFWPGLWHGLIMPITFVVSLFNDEIGVYDVHNNGGWYNFGFLLGAIIIFGGGRRGSARRGRKPA
ncbi:MAG: hypothetical protein HKP61_20105 [Dactylosporangium sp.]|nr:hypothetical protein [Dactylosporangium sp.]NNJ63189.1 hypothetical protein [Dactylosporangium sp.]